MGRIVRTQVKAGATLTATGSVAISIGESYINPEVVVAVQVAGPVTGTSPSMTVGVAPSVDGVRSSAATSGSAITAATVTDQRLVLAQVVEGWVIVSWTITGTTPSFGGVNIDLYTTSEG